METSDGQPIVNTLKKAIHIASSELSCAMQIVPGQEIILNTCVWRVLDGALTSFGLLNVGMFSFVPVIVRAQIEAMAQYKAIASDPQAADRIILVNNKKRIKNMEAAIRSGSLVDKHRKIAAGRSKKAKEENLRKSVDQEMTVSSLVDCLEDDVLVNMYSICSMHSHNDLNEMVSLYVESGNDGSTISLPRGNRFGEINMFARYEIILLFKMVCMYFKHGQVQPNERILELGNLASGLK